MIGVFAFLVAPGLIVPLQFADAFRLAARHEPELLEGLTRLFTTVFLVYAMVAVGVVAAFQWDELVLDRRDAMILGPLPVPGRTVVFAKMAALGVLLLVLGGAINGVTAITFTFAIAGASTQGATALLRTVVAHVVTTMTASALIFFFIVTIRCVLSVVGKGRVVIGSLFQCAIVGSLFCFLVLAPTTVHVNLTMRRATPTTVQIQAQSVPAWLPTRWFVGMYDLLRGVGQPTDARLTLIAVGVTGLVALLAAIAMFGSYSRQLRAALAPTRSEVLDGPRWPKVLVRTLSSRHHATQTLSEFIVTTIARNRGPQSLVAINASIGIVMMAMDLSFHRANIAARVWHLSPLPLMLVFWIAVGLRASFYVPAELPAAWVFRTQALEIARIRFAAIRGAMAVLLLPLAVVATTAVSVVGPPGESVTHVGVVAAATMFLVEVLAWTVRFTPYTRSYEPGHAKLKTRWPFYVASSLAFVYGVSAAEHVILGRPLVTVLLLVALAALWGWLDWHGRRRPATGGDDEPVSDFRDLHLGLLTS